MPLDKTPRALDVSPDGKWLYFTVAGADSVQVLNTATNKIVGQISVGASPHYPLFTPNWKIEPGRQPGSWESRDSRP